MNIDRKQTTQFYQSGEYFEKHPSLHTEDSEWKFSKIKKILNDLSSGRVGDEIHILDSAANFDSANLTVARNSLKIQGLTADLTLTTESTGIGLVYMSSTYGWRVLVDAYNVDTTEL